MGRGYAPGVEAGRSREPRLPSSSVRSAAAVSASSLLTPDHGPHRLTLRLPAPRRGAALRPNRPSSSSHPCGVSDSLCSIVRWEQTGRAGSATPARYRALLGRAGGGTWSGPIGSMLRAEQIDQVEIMIKEALLAEILRLPPEERIELLGDAWTRSLRARVTFLSLSGTRRSPRSGCWTRTLSGCRGRKSVSV